ncbi:hypothetical protein GGR26_002241 [Lewinella marina]|uniref:ER-bound oxygenase mpaB/mpaB'/Rubber oxygenase catalytic domain-containing protein n=1 Tax=Neolewinella marina TaxID=438751 RepID=A0A2G0CGM2_9BACT|nr:oxygenase MpaB family protein [Neolewinella marina]NJB86473.1 hypothetical protein [Neolewinella marina]PHK99067.1 hypothetical protein CGL56_06295 [Neolewinella marina]
MPPFVAPHSIVRRIWGNGDTILFIFAGAAAEFALNKAVDWLYFTGRLPTDPMGRLFSTVAYARTIVFSEEAAAHRAIDAMAHIHSAVEAQRGTRIPDWAYRDVLYLLIDYSMRAHEILEHPLTPPEKEEVFTVFHRVGSRMGVKDLPATFPEWEDDRQAHLNRNLARSPYTDDLFRQYRKHLGPLRYFLLGEAQRLVVPGRVAELLDYRRDSLIRPLLGSYKWSRRFRLDGLLKSLILPSAYKNEIRSLDVAPGHRMP